MFALIYGIALSLQRKRATLAKGEKGLITCQDRISGFAYRGQLESRCRLDIATRRGWKCKEEKKRKMSECKVRFQNTESYWDIQETIKKKPSRKGGNDGCGEVNSATFPIFAWYCHPCQLLNASVSQTCVHLARAPLQQGCGRSDSITLSNTQRLPGTNRDSRIYEVLSGCTMKKKIRHQHCVWLTGRHTAQSMRRTHHYSW